MILAGRQTEDILIDLILPVLVLSGGMFVSIYCKKLTQAGGLSGGIIGALVFLGAGYTGLGMLALFFGLGTAATRWCREIKRELFYEPARDTGRTAGQVIANGGIAGLCGLGIILLKEQKSLLIIMMAASLASATADTLASELGTIYGRRFFNCLTFKKDEKGLDGVISLEGTLIGAIGALLIAILFSLGYGFSRNLTLICICGMTGNLADSILGAAFERRGQLKNDQVNFLSTLIAAIIAGISYFSFL